MRVFKGYCDKRSTKLSSGICRVWQGLMWRALSHVMFHQWNQFQNYHARYGHFKNHTNYCIAVNHLRYGVRLHPAPLHTKFNLKSTMHWPMKTIFLFHKELILIFKMYSKVLSHNTIVISTTHLKIWIFVYHALTHQRLHFFMDLVSQRANSDLKMCML